MRRFNNWRLLISLVLISLVLFSPCIIFAETEVLFKNDGSTLQPFTCKYWYPPDPGINNLIGFDEPSIEFYDSLANTYASYIMAPYILTEFIEGKAFNGSLDFKITGSTNHIALAVFGVSITGCDYDNGPNDGRYPIPYITYRNKTTDNIIIQQKDCDGQFERIEFPYVLSKDKWHHVEFEMVKNSEAYTYKLFIDDCEVYAGISYEEIKVKENLAVTLGAWGSDCYTHVFYDNIRVEIEDLNEPPVANAGENKTIISEDQSTTILTGTATDPNGNDLEYRWLENSSVLLDWTPVGASGEANLDLNTIQKVTMGEHTLTLEVRDNLVIISDDMILTVDNSAPHVQATGAGVYEIFSDVMFGGNVSDYDGDNLSYEWSWDGNSLFSGIQETIIGGDPVNLPVHIKNDLGLGLHTLTLKAEDDFNVSLSSDIIVEIVDTTVPTIAPIVNKSILWPPNHQMVDIEVVANANDNSGGPITLSATVVSNEPIDGTGDGDMAPDWTEPLIQENGIISLQLRSERSGSGNCRIYTLSITATDDSDNFSTVDVDISVPHNNSKKK